MTAAPVLNALIVLLLILGAVFTFLGLIPPTRVAMPWAFNSGIIMLVLGFMMLVVTLVIPGL